MLADAKARQFDVLLVDDISRLSRDQVEAESTFRRLEHWGIRVISASDVLGDATLDVVFAPKRFAEANPKTMTAFLAAMDEANKLIADDAGEAAKSFMRISNAKVSEEEVLKMIQDKDSHFSTTPKGLMQYAEFMSDVGSIKVKPTSWKDMFMLELHGRAGS